MNIVAMKIHVPLTIDIGKVNAFTGFEHIEAGTGQGLMEIYIGIPVQVFKCGFIKGFVPTFTTIG